MNKRIEKNHKRQVARAKAKKQTSQPDVRTPDQIKAAREASQPKERAGFASKLSGMVRSLRGKPAAGTGSAAKTDG